MSMYIGNSHNAMHSMYPAHSRVHTPVKTTKRKTQKFGVPMASDEPDAGLDIAIPNDGSIYGYVATGTLTVGDMVIPAGHVFALPQNYDKVTRSEDATVWVIARHGYRSQVVVTKPENKGRLSYIDGCSDTLLVYPTRRGDGSLSLLYFPPNIDQSWHTHPSIRLGYVASGAGTAHWRDPISGKSMTKPLKAGDSFLLDEHCSHRFCTAGKEMRILAYHPDGDWGPEDHNHTMLNRTYLNKK